MTDFAALDLAAAREVLAHLGEDITFTEVGQSAKTIRALVEVDVDRPNAQGQLTGRWTSLEILKAEILSTPLAAAVVVRGVALSVKVQEGHDGVMTTLLAK